MCQQTEGTQNSLLQWKSNNRPSGLRQLFKPGHIGCTYKGLIKIILQQVYWRAICANIIILNSHLATQKGALEMSSICLCRPFQVPAQTCISGSPLITENKTDLANENPSHEHLVFNNLARAVTSADRLNIMKPMESVSGWVCCLCFQEQVQISWCQNWGWSRTSHCLIFLYISYLFEMFTCSFLNPACESLPVERWWSGPSPPQSRTSVDWWQTWLWVDSLWTPPDCPASSLDQRFCKQNPRAQERSWSNVPLATPAATTNNQIKTSVESFHRFRFKMQSCYINGTKCKIRLPPCGY